MPVFWKNKNKKIQGVFVTNYKDSIEEIEGYELQ